MKDNGHVRLYGNGKTGPIVGKALHNLSHLPIPLSRKYVAGYIILHHGILDMHIVDMIYDLLKKLIRILKRVRLPAADLFH